MIWDSVIKMTVVDVIVISLTSFAFWNFFRNRNLLKRLRVFLGIAFVLFGLIIITYLYLADMTSMFILPQFMPREKALSLMRDLHMNYSWILSTAGIAIIVSSLLYLNQIIFPRIIKLEKELKRRASTDSLTHALNRSEYDEIIKREITRAERYNCNLSLVLLDIDHFKKINDTHGHLAGDEVLKEMVAVTHGNIRNTDYLIRWGGEEFIVILPETDLKRAEELVYRIKMAIEEFDFKVVNRMTVSFGITQFQSGDTGVEFIKRADDALYKAKTMGRNKVVVNF